RERERESEKEKESQTERDALAGFCTAVMSKVINRSCARMRMSILMRHRRSLFSASAACPECLIGAESRLTFPLAFVCVCVCECVCVGVCVWYVRAGSV